MKYYYKNPDVVRQEQTGRVEKQQHPLRNRTFLMVLADVSIFLLIGGILYQTGALDGYFSTSAGLEITAESYDPKRNELRLKIHNAGKYTATFPPEDSTDKLEEPLEILYENPVDGRLYRDGGKSQGDETVFEKWKKQTREIEPENSEIFITNLPDELWQSLQTGQKVHAELRFAGQKRNAIFTVPANRTDEIK